MSQENLKRIVAQSALEHLTLDGYIGIGTGSTMKHFIQCLEPYRSQFLGAVSSSIQTTNLLKKAGIPVVDMNELDQLSFYVDGADEVDGERNLIKGGGGALTKEKIIASLADQFICIVDHSKLVKTLGKFPLPLEVIPMARSAVARHLVKTYGAEPVYRSGYVTDQGNIILDVHHLKMENPLEVESELNQIPGVVSNGIFAQCRADKVLVARDGRAGITVDVLD